ncbi:MAG: hypothetical protein H6733_07490 [Alphaproteobacteria bacterium]|nr:hypothetical protein [Alphaproteobacteria bacterium]
MDGDGGDDADPPGVAPPGLDRRRDADVVDLDSDDDGVPDAVERGAPALSGLDVDRAGLDDGVDRAIDGWGEPSFGCVADPRRPAADLDGDVASGGDGDVRARDDQDSDGDGGRAGTRTTRRGILGPGGTACDRTPTTTG